MENKKIPILLMFQNQKFWTLKTLEYLIKNTDKNKYQLILINNGSNPRVSDQVFDFANSNIDNVENISYPDGIGVSFAYMEAAYRYCEDSEKFVILHNDVFVTEGWLESLLDCSESIGDEDGIGWLSIFPRTNYSTEESPSMYDENLKSHFIEYKLPSKSFHNKKTIENNIEEIYTEFGSLESYSLKIKKENFSEYKISQECCVFCTLFNSKVFFKFGGFDSDFLRRRSEAKLLNDMAVSEGFYSIIALDCFVHHHGNLTTDGPGMNFREDLKESDEIYNNKISKFFKDKKNKDYIRTKFTKGVEALFIREGGIGDIIMSMFALEGLKKKYPNVSISYMTKPENMNFVKGFSCIDKVLPINIKYDFNYAEKELIDHEKILKSFKEKFGYIKNWVKYVEYEDKRNVHRIKKFLESIEIENIEPIHPNYIIDSEREKKINCLFGDSSKKNIVICMDGSCKIRSIPQEVAYKIIDLESKKDKNIFVIGNSNPINLNKFKNKDNIFDLGFDLDIEDVFILIKKCEYVYTPDTGIFHMASLARVPSKAFFGSIDPSLRDGGYYDVKNKFYYKEKILPCVPCNDLGCEDVPCMKYANEEIENIVSEKC